MAKELTIDRGETSRSKSVCETVNGSHSYTIKGYSLAKGMGPGKYISSDTFSVDGYHWAVYFYPDGKNPEDNSAYVSVFVALASEGTDVRALFELTLFDQSGKGKHKVHSHFDRAMVSGPYTLKYRGSMWYVLILLFKFQFCDFPTIFLLGVLAPYAQSWYLFVGLRWAFNSLWNIRCVGI